MGAPQAFCYMYTHTYIYTRILGFAPGGNGGLGRPPPKKKVFIYRAKSDRILVSDWICGGAVREAEAPEALPGDATYARASIYNIPHWGVRLHTRMVVIRTVCGLYIYIPPSPKPHRNIIASLDYTTSSSIFTDTNVYNPPLLRIIIIIIILCIISFCWPLVLGPLSS